MNSITSTIMNLGGALAIALAFLTALPAPRAEWTFPCLRYVPAALPLVGGLIGILNALFFMAISGWNVSVMFRGVLMTLFSLGVTGGLHMDGFMDTCDAVFSRQDRKARLEILTDTHTGAFAVMGCVSLLLLRAGIFSELLPRFHQRSHTGIPLLLALIPFYSRAGLGILFYLPFARKEGLVRTLGEARVPRDRFVLVAGYAAASAVPMLRLGLRGEMVPLAAAAFFLLYRPYCLKTFGGICGDLMGAFVELSETLMLLTLVAGGL